VACVVPALEPNHALRRLGQPIHQFAFAFVAPLGSDNHHIATLEIIHEMEKVSGVKGLDMPLGALAHQLAVAVEFVSFAVMPGQDTHHGFA